MSMLRVASLQKPLAFVDIETNGLSHVRGRVIEVAAIRVESGAVTQQFRTLLNPQAPLPQFITQLTGITEQEVASAPVFADIAAQLRQVLDGALFVAHNVRFDYSFLKQEFARLGQPFLPQQLCTVKLSRALYPLERSHKLADIIRRHNLRVSARHRAYDDALVLWQFLQELAKNFPPEQIESVIARQLRSPAMPKSLEPDLVRNLPEAPGVYIFEDEAEQPLYVGKSVNIKKRVLSHFGRDHAESKEFKISQSVQRVRALQTPGELTALLLESQLVKQLQPVYNKQLRRTQKLLLLRELVTPEGYSTVHLEEAYNIDPTSISNILAVYTQRGKAREAIEAMAKLYDLCPKLLGLEKTKTGCFWTQLKRCGGACLGQEPASSYNRRLHTAFERQRLQAWPYDSAILIEEKSARQPGGIIVDNWCVLGEAGSKRPMLGSTPPRQFDLDTYNILHTFLSFKRDKVTVTPMPQAHSIGIARYAG